MYVSRIRIRDMYISLFKFIIMNSTPDITNTIRDITKWIVDITKTNLVISDTCISLIAYVLIRYMYISEISFYYINNLIRDTTNCICDIWNWIHDIVKQNSDHNSNCTCTYHESQLHIPNSGLNSRTAFHSRVSFGEATLMVYVVFRINRFSVTLGRSP